MKILDRFRLIEIDSKSREIDLKLIAQRNLQLLEQACIPGFDEEANAYKDSGSVAGIELGSEQNKDGSVVRPVVITYRTDTSEICPVPQNEQLKSGEYSELHTYLISKGEREIIDKKENKVKVPGDYYEILLYHLTAESSEKPQQIYPERLTTLPNLPSQAGFIPRVVKWGISETERDIYLLKAIRKFNRKYGLQNPDSPLNNWHYQEFEPKEPTLMQKIKKIFIK